MNSVLFVCLGNICRSPLAEGILRQKAAHAGLSLAIDSAGTGHWHVGEKADKRALQTARTNGIDLSQHRARQITGDDFENYDLLLVADTEVYHAVMQLTPAEKHKDKVDFIMNLLYPRQNLSVPDPYYGGMNGFEKVFLMLDKACDALIEKIQNHAP